MKRSLLSSRFSSEIQRSIERKAMSSGLRLGTAVAEVTPKHPLPLAGFAMREGDSEGVMEPLVVRVFAFSQDGERGERNAVLVCADLLWWGPERVPGLRREASERWGIEEQAVVFHATHTHSGPQTSRRFASQIGTLDREYVAFLEERTFQAIDEAFSDLEPVAVERGREECRIGINRRLRIGDEVAGSPGDASVGGPDPDGAVDPEVVVIRFPAEDGRTKAVLVHYACHPVISAERLVSPDFPGMAMRRLEGALGDGVVAAYLQGCCGDINPAVIRNGEFYRGGAAEIQAFGDSLAGAALEALSRPMTRLSPALLDIRRATVELPLQELPAREKLEALRGTPGVMGEWSETLLREPERLRETTPLELTLLQLADGLAFLAMDAEVTVPYGLFIKERFGGRVLPLPYSNGMIGYAVTARQLEEGGYEPEGSTPYFLLPAPFASDIEERIKDGVTRLVEG
jgi:hypothetical protein